MSILQQEAPSGWKLNPEWEKATHFIGVPQFDGTIREGFICHSDAFNELKVGPEPINIFKRPPNP